MTFDQEEVVLHEYLPCPVSFSACLEVVWRFEQRTFYIHSLSVKLILVCQEVLK